MGKYSAATGGQLGKNFISGKGGSAKSQKSAASSVKVKGASQVSKSFRTVKSQASRHKTTSGSGSLITGGKYAWSGASGAAGGTMGKTYGSGKSSPKGGSTGGVKPLKMTGHTAGTMPGNMMAHSSKTAPFQNTGMHPAGGKLQEISTGALTSSQAKSPGAAKLDAGYKNKLQNSTPYSASPVLSTNSWTGASGTVGGTSGKTFGRKLATGQVNSTGKKRS